MIFKELNFLENDGIIRTSEFYSVAFETNKNESKYSSNDASFTIKRNDKSIVLTENVSIGAKIITIEDGCYIYDTQRKTLIITNLSNEEKKVLIFTIKF